MRRVALSSLALTLVLAGPGRAAGRDAAPAPTWNVDAVRVHELTGDRLLTEAACDSAVRRLLALPRFETADDKTSRSSLTSADMTLPNPFRLDDGRVDGTGLTLELDLELVYYGPELQPNTRVTTFPLAVGTGGPLGTSSVLVVGGTMASSTFLAAVQWRATLLGPRPGDVLVRVSSAGVTAKPAALSRRDGLSRANHRALYQLAYALAEALDHREHAEVKPAPIDGDPDDYGKRAEGW